MRQIRVRRRDGSSEQNHACFHECFLSTAFHEELENMQWTAALSEKNTHITTLDAMLDLGILRLASRISELKKAGVPIRRDWAKVTNRHGETCNVLRYSLDGSLDTPGGEE